MHTIEYLVELDKNQQLQDIEWALCADPKDGLYYWLTHWARTLDVHDLDNPMKPFPDKPYLKIIADKWLSEKLLLIPKSRQMMISWIMTACFLWDTQFKTGRLTFFQSKKEEDADDLVKRAKFIWDNQPKFLKRYKDENGELKPLKANPQNKGKPVYCRIVFPDIYSEIRGVPQGGDVLRMHTASGVYSDEMSFQNEAMAAYTASKPTISAKGRFVGVSTAEDNTFFSDMVFDKIET